MSKPTTTAQAASPQTGEIQQIKYFDGTLSEYRFNGQNGRFNINGITDIGVKFTFLPVAWRFFKDELFGRGRMDDWAEIFFVDAQGCLSGIMFTNSSALEIVELLPKLYYAGLSLTEVVLTVTSEKKVTDKGEEKVSWYLAKFDFEPAPVEEVARLAEFAKNTPIFRRETITPSVIFRSASDYYPVKMARLLVGLSDEQPEDADFDLVVEDTKQAA